MDRFRLDEILERTLDDRRLSRGERKALRSAVENLAPDTHDLLAIRARVFAAAVDALEDSRDAPVLEWLHDVLGVLHGLAEVKAGTSLEVLFSPGDACVQRIASLYETAVRTADACVYTITDNRIASAVLGAHERGVLVRVISDCAKADDAGSDVDRLASAGIAVAFDDSPHQMHNKFAVFDGAIVLTGSYNWTRSAAEHNRENIVVSDDLRMVHAFEEEFERLWGTFAR